MEPSQMQVLIGSLQLGKLTHPSRHFAKLATNFSTMQDEQATNDEVGQPGDMMEWPADRPAWVLAQAAQSCVSLAVAIQSYADILSQSQIRCPESTYRRLCDSADLLVRWLVSMQRSFAEGSVDGYDLYLLGLSEHMAEAIRSTLEAEAATTSDGSTTKRKSQVAKNTASAGDTR